MWFSPRDHYGLAHKIPDTPGRRTDFINDPQVNARRQEAISRIEATEGTLKTKVGSFNPPAPDLPGGMIVVPCSH
jgi:hypothetical protein